MVCVSVCVSVNCEGELTNVTSIYAQYAQNIPLHFSLAVSVHVAVMVSLGQCCHQTLTRIKLFNKVTILYIIIIYNNF